MLIAKLVQFAQEQFATQADSVVHVELACQDAPETPVAVHLRVAKAPSRGSRSAVRENSHVIEVVRSICAELVEAIAGKDAKSLPCSSTGSFPSAATNDAHGRNLMDAGSNAY